MNKAVILRTLPDIQRLLLAFIGILTAAIGTLGCAPPIPQESTPYVVEADPLAALTPCPPSFCWRGRPLADLDLGTVTGLVRNIKGYQDVDVSDEGTEANYRSYAWFRPPGRQKEQKEPQYVEYVSENGEFLVIGQSFPSVGIGDVIARFGEPSHVSIYLSSGPSSGEVGFTLFYEDKSLVFHGNPFRNHEPTMARAGIPPDASISAYDVTKPGTLSELIHANLLTTRTPLAKVDAATERWLQAAQNWRGYTTYDVGGY